MPEGEEEKPLGVSVKIFLADGTPDGLACVAEARLRAGADALRISVVGKADERLVARFRLEYAKTGDADGALRLMRAWARGQADLRDAHHWASLVLWGVR